METKAVFTLKEAFAIQKDQLNDWKTILKDEIYLMLMAECQKRNRDVIDPFEVFRGTDMDQFIYNYMYEIRNKNL
ncbi:MAG TPA: hypothetical protein VF487_13255 [Chitinophagaceae bacterium]